MQQPNFQEAFKEGYLPHATPDDMDWLLADAWRHFGTTFFRNRLDFFDDKWVSIIPLRINLAKFSFSKHHKKLLHRQQKTTIKYQAIMIDSKRELMFQNHIQRFKDNVPTSIFDFLGYEAGISPCAALECALYDENEKLYACSYFDASSNAISSIYAMFDTDYSKQSPGLHTLLAEILFAIEHQKQYLYLGYAHDVASHYDYKKQFNGLEFYDWEGNWADYEKN
jgi:leucyl-tRNA---protein transferase